MRFAQLALEGGVMPDKRSPEAQAYRALYHTRRWRQARKRQLTAHPLCAVCLADGAITEATVVHHKTPHKGDERLFWDPSNHESVCKAHHDGPLQSEEAIGYSRAVGADGWPADPRHPANKWA